MDKKKTYIVDIDGTICRHDSKSTPYSRGRPIKERIDFFNQLYDAGHTIIYWTARGANSGVDHSELTEKQLRMGKPSYDYWIDDKAFNVQDFFMTDVRTGETKSMTL
jgi:ribonucleotide monophosphatase NagD (HAD superfamily)